MKPVTYAVIKTGIIGLTRYLATYWADRGVDPTRCASAASPGTRIRRSFSAFERIPLGRMANEGEYGDAMVFLCSDASSYVTGACLVLDGGRTAW